MIVNRRNELGGFYSAEQLREIENIPDSIVDALIPFISIELDSLKRIDINKASIKRLHRHPYIDYYQAKAIYDLRWDKQHKGAIRNMEEIRKLKEFENDEEFERVKWYLRIEN
jgi:DNA uptake protein ComE-like DNA-binding protein